MKMGEMRYKMILIILEPLRVDTIIKTLHLQIKSFIQDAKYLPGKVTKVAVVLIRIIKLMVSMANQVIEIKKVKFLS